MDLATKGQAIFSVLLENEIVIVSEKVGFLHFFVSNEIRSKYNFQNGPLKKSGWFQKGVGVCCDVSTRTTNISLLRKTNGDLQKVKDFHRHNPTPEQQQNFISAMKGLTSGEGIIDEIVIKEAIA